MYGSPTARKPVSLKSPYLFAILRARVDEVLAVGTCDVLSENVLAGRSLVGCVHFKHNHSE